MILGIVILKKKYSVREYAAITMISVGICLCTIASSNDYKKLPHSVKSNLSDESSNAEADLKEFIYWMIGLAMLTLGLILSAGMGLVQETLYKKYGKHPYEALYYNVST